MREEREDLVENQRQKNIITLKHVDSIGKCLAFLAHKIQIQIILKK